MSAARVERSGCPTRSIAVVIVSLAFALVLAFAHSAFANVVTGHSRLVTARGPVSRLRSNARSATASPDPSSNYQLSPATNQACGANDLSAGCESLVLADINAARASEGVPPMVLPSGYDSLTTPQQLLVVANLERIGRGLIPAAGLSGSLNAVAAVAALADLDPMPALTTGNALTANWAGGTRSPLLADFMWMYDDGPGSGNIDCTYANPSGCWGHRHDLLYPFDAPLAMGAAYAPVTLDGPSLAELFIGGDTATAVGAVDALLAPTWATISQSLQLVLSATSLVLSHGAGAGQIQLSAPGMAMNVRAAITSGGGDWQVSPSGCQLAAGSSCALTLTGRAGSTGTLTLFGPAGGQTVSLANQASTSLRMSLRRTGSALAVKGYLAAAGGAWVGGHLVTLYKSVPGKTGTSVLCTARTKPDGSVTFHDSPPRTTVYSLAFAGSPTLAAAITSAAARGSRHARLRARRRHH